MENALDSVVVAGIVSFVLEHLKKSEWFPFLQDCQRKVNRVVSATLAAASAVGITTAFDASTGTLTITGLTVMTVATGGWIWMKQFFLQEAMYRMLIRERKDGNGAQTVTLTSTPTGLSLSGVRSEPPS